MRKRRQTSRFATKNVQGGGAGRVGGGASALWMNHPPPGGRPVPSQVNRKYPAKAVKIPLTSYVWIRQIV
ncbi:MAG: hypothetical protein ACK5MY_19225 [Jhaorihella sp.]